MDIDGEPGVRQNAHDIHRAFPLHVLVSESLTGSDPHFPQTRAADRGNVPWHAPPGARCRSRLLPPDRKNHHADHHAPTRRTKPATRATRSFPSAPSSNPTGCCRRSATRPMPWSSASSRRSPPFPTTRATKPTKAVLIAAAAGAGADGLAGAAASAGRGATPVAHRPAHHVGDPRRRPRGRPRPQRRHPGDRQRPQARQQRRRHAPSSRRARPSSGSRRCTARRRGGRQRRRDLGQPARARRRRWSTS
mgnify:CR=1 FL=1